MGIRVIKGDLPPGLERVRSDLLLQLDEIRCAYNREAEPILAELVRIENLRSSSVIFIPDAQSGVVARGMLASDNEFVAAKEKLRE